MNQLQSSLKQAKNVEEAWQLTRKFLSRISDKSNRHTIWTIDNSNERTAVRTFGNARDTLKNLDNKHPGTHHMWMLVDPPQYGPMTVENQTTAHFRKDGHGNINPAIGVDILCAHAHILSMKQKERALKAGVTPREREALSLLARGLRSDKIAYRMGIKRVTVNLHISNVRRKLDSTTRAQAVARAVHMGIITP